MLNRDFTKPKKDYILKNKLYWIIALVVIVAGVIVLGVWGMNRSIDYTGCHLVTVNIGEEITDKTFNKYEDKIDNVLASNKLDLYSVQLKGEGSNTSLEIKYTGKLTEEKEKSINAGFIVELNVSSTNISQHEFLQKTIGVRDIIYTATAILLIMVIAVVFTIFRHNIAYALSLMAGGFAAVLSTILCSAILRVQIQESYLALLVLTLVYTLFETIILFENMREVRTKKEDRKAFAKHIVNGMKKVDARLQFTAIALFVIGLLFVFFGTSLSRSIAINMMFGVVASLFAVCFVVPFVYNLTIDKVKFNANKKEKAESKEKAENKTEKNVKVVESKVVEQDAKNNNDTTTEESSKEQVESVAETATNDELAETKSTVKEGAEDAEKTETVVADRTDGIEATESSDTTNAKMEENSSPETTVEVVENNENLDNVKKVESTVVESYTTEESNK